MHIQSTHTNFALIKSGMSLHYQYKYTHITPVRHNLHWLHTEQYSVFKTALLGYIYLFIWGFTSLSTLQAISRWVVGRAEETSTYSSSGFCTVNCRPMASDYPLSHLRPCQESNPSLRGGRREWYHSATVAPLLRYKFPQSGYHNYLKPFLKSTHCVCTRLTVVKLMVPHFASSL